MQCENRIRIVTEVASEVGIEVMHSKHAICTADSVPNNSQAKRLSIYELLTILR
jgi:hypothetical protein